jgi:hypothetical protein
MKLCLPRRVAAKPFHAFPRDVTPAAQAAKTQAWSVSPHHQFAKTTVPHSQSIERFGKA